MQVKIILPVLLLLAFGLGLILLDRERIIQILGQADFGVLPRALIFVVCSNSLVSISYVILAGSVGMQMGRLEQGTIFYVTNVMNRLVMSGGAAGFSLRYLMMKPYGVRLDDVLNTSFIHFLLGSLIMLGMLPLVVIYILLTLPVAAGMIFALIFLAISGALLCLGIAFFLFSERLRSSAARLAIWLGMKVIRRDFSARVDEYTQRAAWAVAALRQDWKGFFAVMGLLLAEWGMNVIVLGYCLRAFGFGLSFGGVAAIYVVATTAGVMTALPGGIGIQEWMITSLAVVQGSSFEQAALAAILYRILQSFLPYLLSLGFYPYLLKGGATEINPSNIRT